MHDSYSQTYVSLGRCIYSKSMQHKSSNKMGRALFVVSTTMRSELQKSHLSILKHNYQLYNSWNIF